MLRLWWRMVFFLQLYSRIEPPVRRTAFDWYLVEDADNLWLQLVVVPIINWLLIRFNICSYGGVENTQWYLKSRVKMVVMKGLKYKVCCSSCGLNTAGTGSIQNGWNLKGLITWNATDMFQHGSIGPPICHLTPRLSSKLAGQLQKYAAKLACGSTCQVLILPSPIHRLKPRPQRKTPCNYAPKAYFQEKISLSHPSLILSPFQVPIPSPWISYWTHWLPPQSADTRSSCYSPPPPAQTVHSCHLSTSNSVLFSLYW